MKVFDSTILLVQDSLPDRKLKKYSKSTSMPWTNYQQRLGRYQPRHLRQDSPCTECKFRYYQKRA